MDLLTNAVESIQVGIEDWQVGSRARLLSAVRNIHAGILLLFKEALLRASPTGSDEALIKSRLLPKTVAGSGVQFIGVGRKTVDTQQIRERFDSLGIKADWTLFKSISDVRNDVEHYYIDVSKDSLRGVIASAFLIIRSFSVDELEEEPRELLGQSTWETMLKAAEVNAAERTSCDEAISKVDWESGTLEDGLHSLRCHECGSDLLRPDGGDSYADVTLTCRSCGDKMTASDFIPRALTAALDRQLYIFADDGAEEPLADCPSCYKSTYVMDERRCAYCGHVAAHDCWRCGGSIPASEMSSSPLCGYCEHMMSKDD